MGSKLSVSFCRLWDRVVPVVFVFVRSLSTRALSTSYAMSSYPTEVGVL